VPGGSDVLVGGHVGDEVRWNRAVAGARTVTVAADESQEAAEPLFGDVGSSPRGDFGTGFRGAARRLDSVMLRTADGVPRGRRRATGSTPVLAAHPES